MAFLAPLFFAALATLAIPVLIHLTQRERKQIVVFPSLMFLEKIPYQSVRRRRIRDWPLLALRVAAIMLIVLAFARPFFERPIAALAHASGPRDVVILLDRSYSMGYGDRWARAQASAREIVQGLGRGDHATLILFGTSAQLEVRATADLSRVTAAIDSAKLSAEATRYAPGIKLAQRVLAESTLSTREVVMVSDFQRNGWVRDENLRLPEGTTFRAIAITDAQTANLTVSSVLPQRSMFSGQERITVTAGVINRGSAAANVQVHLELDGRNVESQAISVQPGSPASVTFPAFTLARPFTRGVVRIGDDGLKRDNAFHFIASPSQRLGVLILDPPGASRDASLYLQKALAIGTTPAFQVSVRQGESVSSADLGRHRVVILNDAAALSSGDVLKQFVSQGGGLFVVLGERANWGTDSNDLLPGLPGTVVDRPGRGGSLAELDYSHPILEVFKAPRSGNLSTARVFRYRAIAMKSATPDKKSQAPPDARVVARFDDGAVAMAARRIGSGSVFLWASTLDNYWNDLALKPVYLPFVHEVVRHLATYEEPAHWFTIGGVVDPGHLLQASGVGLQSGTGALVLTPDGRRLEQSGTPAPVQLDQAGFYEIRSRGNQSGAVSIAANVDTAESDLSMLDTRELSAALSGRPGSVNSVADAAVVTPEDQEKRQNFWWYLLVAGLVLLGLETAISNRMKGPDEGTRLKPVAAE